VAPEHSPPAEPVLYGFAYTRPSEHARASFVVAGAGDVERQELDSQRIVRAGESSVQAMRQKASHVMAVMGERVRDLGLAWSDATLVNVYTVRELQPYLRDTLLEPMGKAGGRGLHWHYAWPPIAGLEFEMDLRGVRSELYL
ncbi:MAG: 2-amino-5-chloromuconate deaminase CnbZ, partial [Gammaproteobacteria bacterium]